MRALRNPPKSQIRPLPQATSRALLLLFLSAVVFFLSTFPVFHPSNIFRQTHSRLQTSPGVLLTRLAALRPLTPADEALRNIFDGSSGLEPRLLYARYGPTTLLTNTLVHPSDLDAGRIFLLYALPAHLLPHLAHLAVLGFATSSFIAGRDAGRWRTFACLAGIGLAAAECYLLATYDDGHNRRSTRVTEIDFFYWKLLLWRGLAGAAVDALLGWAIWLGATGRMFVTPLTPAERLRAQQGAWEAVLNKVRGLGVLRNAIVRDPGVRRREEAYWVKEGEVMKDVFEEPEVLEAQRNALKRLDMVRIGREAEAFVDNCLAPLTTGAAPVANS